MLIWVIVVIFLGACVLMYTKKLNAMFALPIMALLIAIVAGIPWADVTQGEAVLPGLQTLLFSTGPLRLGSTMITFIFGAIMAQLVKNSGIAETAVRKVSELAGDHPLVLCIALYAILSVLYTSMGGLGSIIMLGSIVLPIMVSAGVPPLVAGSILIFSSSVGGIFNLTNWSLYIDSLGLSIDTIRSFAWFSGAVFGLMGLVFIVVEVKFGGIKGIFKKKGTRAKLAWPIPAADNAAVPAGKKVHWFAMLTPLVPLIAVIGFQMNINTGFALGILYGFLTTIGRGSLQQLTKSVTEGIANSAGALFLLVGIGMLLVVVMDARVTAIIAPTLAAVLPATALGFVIFFSILAPLALYRGPLNVWGLGLGLAGVMVATGRLGATSIMAALMTTGQIQGICDPTNTGNVWTAAATGTDANDILKKTLPYVWFAVIIGLVVAAFLYF